MGFNTAQFNGRRTGGSFTPGPATYAVYLNGVTLVASGSGSTVPSSVFFPGQSYRVDINNGIVTSVTFRTPPAVVYDAVGG